MSIAFVQEKHFANGNTQDVSVDAPAMATTSGNTLVVGVGYNKNADIGTTVTDTAGNVYVDAGILLSDGVHIQRLYYATNITGDAANVVHVVLGTACPFSVVGVMEFSGIASSPLIDKQTANATGTAMATPTLTLAGFPSAVIYAIGVASGGVTAGTGYSGPGFGSFFGHEYKIVTASEAAVMTNGTSSTWGMTAAMFGASGSAVASVLNPAPRPINIGRFA